MAPKIKVSSNCEFTSNASAPHVARLLRTLEPVRSATIISPNHVELPSIHCAHKAQLTIKKLLSSQYSVALTIPRNDSQDSFLLRNGILYCNLSSASFKRFGLEGSRYGDRYFKAIDIHKPSKLRDRLEWAAENTMLDTYDFVVFDDNASQEAARPALSKVLIPPNFRHHILNDPEEFQDWANYLIEYIGLSVLCPEVLRPENGGIDPAIFDYTSPYPSQSPQEIQARYLNTSLLSRDLVQLWEVLVSQPWAILHVQGHDGSPIAFQLQSPHKLGDEYGYTIIKQPNGEFAVLMHKPFEVRR